MDGNRGGATGASRPGPSIVQTRTGRRTGLGSKAGVAADVEPLGMPSAHLSTDPRLPALEKEPSDPPGSPRLERACSARRKSPTAACWAGPREACLAGKKPGKKCH